MIKLCESNLRSSYKNTDAKILGITEIDHGNLVNLIFPTDDQNEVRLNLNTDGKWISNVPNDYIKDLFKTSFFKEIKRYLQTKLDKIFKTKKHHVLVSVRQDGSFIPESAKSYSQAFRLAKMAIANPKKHLSENMIIAEGEVGIAASPTVTAGDADALKVGPGGGIETRDVLGDYKPGDGFLGKGDFHLPAKLKVPFNRWSKSQKPLYPKKKNLKPKIITSYSDLVEAEFSLDEPGTSLVYNLQKRQVLDILDNTEITNPRYTRSQFTKYLQHSDGNDEFIGLFKDHDKQCLALAVLRFEMVDEDECYIAEIQTLKKGYGKSLLKAIIKQQKNVWLMANPRESDSLLSYYRQKDFGFKEYIIQNSIYGCPTHFFFTKTCDEQKLCNYIDDHYTEDSGINEDMISGNSYPEKHHGDFIDYPCQDDNSWGDLIEPNQLVKSNDILFAPKFTKPVGHKYFYTAEIGSVNGDPQYDDSKTISSNEPLTVKQIFLKLWPESARKFNLDQNMEVAHREYNMKVLRLKNRADSEEEFIQELRTIPFPLIKSMYIGKNKEDGIAIVPDKNIFTELTKRNIPAALCQCDDSSELEFNKPASDLMLFRTMTGDSI